MTVRSQRNNNPETSNLTQLLGLEKPAMTEDSLPMQHLNMVFVQWVKLLKLTKTNTA